MNEAKLNTRSSICYTFTSFLKEGTSYRCKQSAAKHKNPLYSFISEVAFVNLYLTALATTEATDGPDCIQGSQDADTISGKGGDDIIYGNGGDDTIYGNGGNDVLYGNEGADKIYGGQGNDKIYGYKGNNTIMGESGKDSIYGGDGDDTIYGNDGNDIIFGNDGNDTIYGNEDNDLVFGGAGNDTIDGGKGNDAIYGNNGNDKIYGELNDTLLDGGEGYDSLYFNEDIDFDAIRDTLNQKISNFEQLHLGYTGDDTVKLNNMTAADIFAMTDNKDTILKIKGDKKDSVGLKGFKVSADTSGLEDGHTRYEGIYTDDTGTQFNVKVDIDSDISVGLAGMP